MRFYTVPDARAARHVGVLRDGPHRRLLPDDVRARLRRDGARRAGRDPRGRPGRQHGRAAARRVPRRARRSSASSPRWRSRRSSRSWRGSRSRARRRCRTTSGSTWCARGRPTPERAAPRGARRDRRRSASSRCVLGITFKGQNVAFMVSLAFAIAASANFPALVLCDLLAALHHGGRGGEHGDRHGRDAAAHLPLADHPGRPPRPRRTHGSRSGTRRS